MSQSKGFKFINAALVAGGVLVPVLTNGCSSASAIQNTLCCKEYVAGADMSATNFNLPAGTTPAVQGQFYAYAQAAGDMSVVGSGALNDVTAACRSIAVDLGGDPNDTGAANLAGPDLLKFWCDKASTSIDATLTKVGLKPTDLVCQISGPTCTASVSAQANCQAHCDVSGKCDIKVNPPVCTGGTLEIDCKGSCDVTATAPQIDCTGSCTGMCTGTCEAQGGVAVNCNGQCQGTCSTAPAADGTCTGTCNGKCVTKAGASVQCQGTCSGKCDAKCDVTPGQVSVKCSGKCSADYTPLECKGGTLSGGCNVSADCQANCSASVDARAECTPPVIGYALTGTVTAGQEGLANLLVTSLQTNMPKFYAIIKARGSQFLTQINGLVSSGGSVLASASLDTHATACLVIIGADATAAAGNFSAALNAATAIVAKVGPC